MRCLFRKQHCAIKKAVLLTTTGNDTRNRHTANGCSVLHNRQMRATTQVIRAETAGAARFGLQNEPPARCLPRPWLSWRQGGASTGLRQTYGARWSARGVRRLGQGDSSEAITGNSQTQTRAPQSRFTS
jgi:hypothetical protein